MALAITAGNFIKNMKKMVDELVYEVRSNKTSKRISSNSTVIAKEVIKTSAKKPISKKEVVGKTCPKCKKGTILKGSSAFGCSEYKNNCNLFLMKFYNAKRNPNVFQFFSIAPTYLKSINFTRICKINIGAHLVFAKKG